MHKDRPSTHVSAATYVELVRSLKATFIPSLIMGGLFAVTAFVCAARSDSDVLFLLAAIGSAVALLRAAVQIWVGTILSRADLDEATARKLERVFGAVYLLFAAIVGMFATLSLYWSALDEQVAVAALVVGFAAGVAAGVSLRPWIAIPALLLSTGPAIAAAAMSSGTSHNLLALILASLMVGGAGSMINRYRGAVEMIEMRQLFASMARQDPLTGLANRLALEDGFLMAVRQCGGRQVVLHCLDLDRFKPVNDAFGHGVGDQLLQAVAGRLSRLVRADDLAVRLGGDEFAVLQVGVEHPDEADLMARRIVRALSEPYTIEGHDIRIGASVGSASGLEHGPILSQLLAVADKALYDVKHRAGTQRVLAG